MTARVCPVHGEYAATGICRWCEPPKRMPTNLPPGSTPCRCGEYAWLPGAAGERSGVIAGVAHSPEQCFKLDAEPAPDAYGESPGASALRDVADLQRAMDQAWCNLVTRGFATVEYRFTQSEAFIDAETHAAEESRLLAEHAALRWERVARRWEGKHVAAGRLNERGRAYVWLSWLHQQRRRWEATLIESGIPKEWP